MTWQNIIHQRIIDCLQSTFYLLLAALFHVWRLDFGPHVVSENGHRPAVAKP